MPKIQIFYRKGNLNDSVWLEGKWMQLEDIMVSEVSQAQKDKGHHVFSHMWKIDPKDKHIYKSYHIQTYM
jgi:hypothetical protein